MNTVGRWEQLRLLGEGGQSEVFLVRSPNRAQERKNALQEAADSNPWELYVNSQERPQRIEPLATALWKYLRPDKVSELGALKMFKIPETAPDAEEALGRLRNEITVLGQKRAGLVKLLEANEKDRWIVTEYMPNGTLDKTPSAYMGNAPRALKAFRSLVEAVASLHKDDIVHRDIKPANVFPGEDDRLILGDLGIVYLPNRAERMTMTNERVGPRDYMPQWGDLGERLENVQSNFDVYMLGKLLWCMVSGRLKLPREYQKRPAYDVTVMFQNDPNMQVISSIIEECVVEEPKQCLKSAQELLEIVDESLLLLKRGLPMLDKSGKFALACRACGKGFYQEQVTAQLPALDVTRRPANDVRLRIFVCNVCTHYQIFAPGFPDEAAQKGWKPWRPN